MKKGWILLLAAICLFCTPTSEAEPRTGFGYNLGLASHSISGTVQPGQGASPGTKYSYRSTGLSLGIDYQIALTETISLNPFLMSSGERVSGDLADGTSAEHGILGIEGRFWLDRIFIGGHIARYSEALKNSSRGNAGAHGPGLGLVAGWEEDRAGLFVMTQVDRAKLHYTGSDNTLTGFRLSVGHRW
jgi:hypothetical protein